MQIASCDLCDILLNLFDKQYVCKYNNCIFYYLISYIMWIEQSLTGAFATIGSQLEKTADQLVHLDLKKAKEVLSNTTEVILEKSKIWLDGLKSTLTTGRQLASDALSQTPKSLVTTDLTQVLSLSPLESLQKFVQLPEYNAILTHLDDAPIDGCKKLAQLLQSVVSPTSALDIMESEATLSNVDHIATLRVVYRAIDAFQHPLTWFESKELQYGYIDGDNFVSNDAIAQLPLEERSVYQSKAHTQLQSVLNALQMVA